MTTLIQSPAVLLKHMLNKNNLSGNRFAQAIGLSSANVNLILNGRGKISVPVALRLAKFFNTAPEYWLVLQMRYDLSIANDDKQLVKEVRAINVFTRPKGTPGRKPSAEKPAPKKQVSKKTSAKKPTEKKAVRKAAPKKAVVKKAAVKKAAPNKIVRKASPKKVGRKPGK